MAVIDSERLTLLVPEGYFDTDEGGRQPEIREQTRSTIRQMMDLADAGWQEHWNKLTTEDALVLNLVLTKLLQRNSELIRVRLTQSHSAKRRGRHRG